ncbi:MAG: tetratricopeptide repeat protein [Polyangiaceae bacterium]
MNLAIVAHGRGKKKPATGARGESDTFEAAEAEVRRASEDEDAWTHLEEIGAASGRAPEVAALYRELVERDDAVARRMGARAVEFHDEWGEEPAALEALVRRVLVVSPSEAWAFDRLKLTFSTEERWGELLEVFDVVLAHAADEGARASLLDDAIKVAKDFARDFERAITYTERLIALRPDERTRVVLERLYERCERHEALVALYRAELPSLDVPAAQALRKKIAGKWLGLGDPDRAFEVIEEMLAVDSEDAGAFELLERIFGTPSRSIPPPSSRRSVPPPASDAAPPSGRAVDPPRSARQRAALRLKPRYLAEGRAQELVRVLEVELTVARTDEARALAFRELAALHLDTLRDDAGALAALSSLVVLEPHEPFHRKALAEVAARLGRQDRQAKVLVAAADRVADAETRAGLLVEAAELCRGALDNAARAIDLFQRVAAIDELPAGPKLAALRALAGLLGDARRLSEKCEALERIAAMEADPEARRSALGELARIAQEDFGDADRAARAWQSRLADDPADAEAVDGLRPVLRGQGRLRELTVALERAAAATRADGASARVAELLREAATIAEDELHDAVTATRCLEALRARAPGEASVMERLASLYAQAGRRTDLLAIRKDQLALAPERAERLRLRFELAAVLEALGDADARIAALEENLVEDPRDERSAAALADALAAASRFGDLVSLSEARARAYEDAGDVARARDLWRTAATLSEERLGDLARAIADHERAGDDPASLDALARLHQSAGDFAASASAIERLARATIGPERVGVELRLATALVAAGRREAARRALERAVDETPDPRLRGMLADIYRAEEAWEQLAQLFAREAELAPDDDARAERLRAAAELHLDKRGDAAAAVPLLQKAAEFSGGSSAIALLLGPALVSVGRVDEAIAILRARVDAFGARRPKERALVHLALARAVRREGDERRSPSSRSP